MRRWQLTTATICMALAACGDGGESESVTARGEQAAATVEAELTVHDPAIERRHGERGTFRHADDGDDLAVGDTLRTDATGFGEIDYPDRSYTRIGPDTTFTVVALATRPAPRIRGRLDLGRSWHRVEKATASDGGFEIETGVAVAAAQGTAFAVDCVDPGGVCRIGVVEGTVEVTTTTGQTVTLGPGEEVEVTADGAAGEVAPLVTDDWITRNITIDRAGGGNEIAAGATTTIAPTAAGPGGGGGGGGGGATPTTTTAPTAPGPGGDGGGGATPTTTTAPTAPGPGGGELALGQTATTTEGHRFTLRDAWIVEYLCYPLDDPSRQGRCRAGEVEDDWDASSFLAAELVVCAGQLPWSYNGAQDDYIASVPETWVMSGRENGYREPTRDLALLPPYGELPAGQCDSGVIVLALASGTGVDRLGVWDYEASQPEPAAIWRLPSRLSAP